MSRYLYLKREFETTMNKKATPTEKKLLCALIMISKAYDENFNEYHELREKIQLAYGKSVITNKVMMRTEKQKKEILSSTKDLKLKALLKKAYALEYLEITLYYISKTIRRGIGFDIAYRNIDKTYKLSRGRVCHKSRHTVVEPKEGCYDNSRKD
jgi:hypothetical protein